MNAEIFFIVICYVALAFLLVLFNLRTSFHWIFKSSMIGIVTLFYILTYNSFKEIVGWPTADILPERFRLIAAQIYEPNALLNSEGSIYLWLTNMDNLAGLGTPRSYELPYSKEIHEKVSKALVDIKNGIPQMGENGEEEEGGILSQILERKKVIAKSQNLNFFDMPNQLLPEK